MLVLEPIFEADLPPELYAYRPGRNAQQAVHPVPVACLRIGAAEQPPRSPDRVRPPARARCGKAARRENTSAMGCCASPTRWMISRRRREDVRVQGCVDTRSCPSATMDSLRTISIRFALTVARWIASLQRSDPKLATGAHLQRSVACLCAGGSRRPSLFHYGCSRETAVADHKQTLQTSQLRSSFEGPQRARTRPHSSACRTNAHATLSNRI